MSRGRGGYIGFNRVPAAGSNGAASGVWTLREAEAARRQGLWPGSPPGGVSAGLQLWLDAADPATLFDATTGGSLVAADGGVARWEDKSGNARHATQSTSANRPQRKTAIQGGKDVLRFDGSNDFLEGSATPGTGDARTVFVVSKYSGTAGADNIELLMIGLVSNNSTSRGFVARGGQGTSNTDVAGDITTNNIRATAIITRTAFAVLTLREDSATRAVAHWTNSVSYATTGNLDSFANMNAGYRVGSRGNAAQAAAGLFFGDIGEIIVYNSDLSDTDREAVENYLIAKWGIT